VRHPTHQYDDDDEQEDNRHEHGLMPSHGMNGGQMAAMFAKMREGGGSGSGTGHAKQGSLGSGGAKDKTKGEHANLMQVVKSKPHTPDMARKSAPKVATPAVKAPKVTAPAGKAPKVTAPKATKPPKVKAPTAHKEHSPLGALKKIGSAVKEGAKKTVEGAVLATGQEPVLGGMKQSLKAHRFGDPDTGTGRHDDR
jgi:hypothetical protein